MWFNPIRPLTDKHVNFFKKLWKNDYLRNILFIVCAVVLLITLIMTFLNLYTRHGSSQPVPDFVGVSLDEAYELAEEHNLRIEISDSVFHQVLPPGSVIDQNPRPEVNVKKDRKIFLVINYLNPKKVDSPNVVGYSLRQGKAVLETRGLAVGKLTYEPDIATNNILEQRYNGRTLPANAPLVVGSEVDLVLGLNSEDDEKTSIPSLIGLTGVNARSRLAEYSLNMGKRHYDSSVRSLSDSISALVYKQSPGATRARGSSLGTRVDIYLTTDESKVPKK